MTTLREYGLCVPALVLSLLLWAVAWDKRDLDGDEYAEAL